MAEQPEFTARRLLALQATAPDPRASVQALVALRSVLAVLIFIHGLHRAFAGELGLGVGLFGEWLGTQGLPFGYAVALAVTLIELVGPPLILAGRLVAPLALLHAAILAVGMVMVHLPFGWFVVGAGRNGMEYSVLLITGLLCLAWTHRPARA
ncbi:DoxX family protein [Altererythrobacter sp. BO-6]|uniref:DoxX family protein n=1 Tax=Altererythrobacter sp. BO-6 TaxID=2604537 RepID=UPI0013E1418A|nr:DoxX family protein [Altererythrobacter sp. BO-6]QIG53700.1 DoxX family protein [Altererythrobacter sp. BO-6]